MNLAVAKEAGARPQRLSQGITLAVGLSAIWGVLAILTLATGMLPLSFHDGDATHLAALVLRMAEGDVPHLDFMTPIGVGSVWPIAGFVQLGAGLGTAVLLAQASLAAVLLPAIWWVATSRFGTGWRGFCFGALALILTMAVTHGGVSTHISVSMHYNRWAWAVSYVILGLILLPSERSAPRIEGVILGVAFTFLALTKTTFFLGLAPAALIALAVRGDLRSMAWALGTGLGFAALMTLVVGPAFWGAYLGDVLSVATSELRGNTGVGLGAFLGGLDHITGTLVLLSAAMIVWLEGPSRERIVLVATVPGLILITWQNFGTEPLWMPILALVLLTMARTARSSQPFVIVACVAGALALPTVLNLASSPLRLATSTSSSAPLLSGVEGHDNYRITLSRMNPGPWGIPSPLLEQVEISAFWGGTIPDCRQAGAGMPGYIAMVEEAANAGFAGRPAMVADYLQAAWLFSDFPRLEGGGPWYYGGLPGVEAAEIMIVPLCAQGPSYRRAVLEALEASGRPVSEVFRGQYAIVLELAR